MQLVNTNMKNRFMSAENFGLIGAWVSPPEPWCRATGCWSGWQRSSQLCLQLPQPPPEPCWPVSPDSWPAPSPRCTWTGRAGVTFTQLCSLCVLLTKSLEGQGGSLEWRTSCWALRSLHLFCPLHPASSTAGCTLWLTCRWRLWQFSQSGRHPSCAWKKHRCITVMSERERLFFFKRKLWSTEHKKPKFSNVWLLVFKHSSFVWSVWSVKKSVLSLLQQIVSINKLFCSFSFHKMFSQTVFQQDSAVLR